MTDLVERLHRNADDCEDQSRWATPELAPFLREAATALEAKDKEIEALRARVKELEVQIHELTDPTLESFHLENGKFNATLGGEIVKRMAFIVTEWFRENGAKNYVEYRINAKTDPFESYVFTVQKVGDDGKTPHELRREAEARAETAERELDALSSSHRDLAKRLAAMGRERDQARAALKLSQTALTLAAARFNLMGGVGLVNGADPRVGYRDAMAAATAARAITGED